MILTRTQPTARPITVRAIPQTESRHCRALTPQIFAKTLTATTSHSHVYPPNAQWGASSRQLTVEIFTKSTCNEIFSAPVTESRYYACAALTLILRRRRKNHKRPVTVLSQSCVTTTAKSTQGNTTAVTTVRSPPLHSTSTTLHQQSFRDRLFLARFRTVSVHSLQGLSNHRALTSPTNNFIHYRELTRRNGMERARLRLTTS